MKMPVSLMPDVLTWVFVTLMFCGCGARYLDGLEVQACGAGTLPLYPAVAARDFMDSIGFGIDLGARESRNANRQALLADLRRLGVTHIKSDALGVRAGSLSDHQSLVRSGIDLLLQLNTGSDVAQLVADIGPALAAVQVPSPNDGGSLNPAPADIAGLTAQVRQEVRALPLLQRPLIIGARMNNGITPGEIPDLSALLDRGALIYGFQPPGGADLTAALKRHQQWYSRVPLWATGGGGYPLLPGSSERPVSARVQAKYLLRFFLELYRNGVQRSYYTKLYDNESFGYGIADAQGERRPAFHALEALASVLADANDVQTKPPLGLQIDDPQGQGDLHQLLFLRSDGVYVLLLWLEVPGAEEDQVRSVTVRLDPRPTRMSLRSLESITSEPTTLTGSNVTVPVSDFPAALELEIDCR